MMKNDYTFWNTEYQQYLNTNNTKTIYREVNFNFDFNLPGQQVVNVFIFQAYLKICILRFSTIQILLKNYY